VRRLVHEVLGYEQIHDPDELQNHPSNKVFLQLHVGSSITALTEDPTIRTIAPLRFPYHSYITRTFRTARFGNPETLRGRAVAMFQRFINECEQGDPAYLPVDSDLDRRKLLQSVVDYIEAPVLDQALLDEMGDIWQKVGSRGPQAERIEYDKTGLIHGETPDFLDFAVEWYKGTILSLNAIH